MSTVTGEPWLLSLQTRLAIVTPFFAQDTHVAITRDGGLLLTWLPDGDGDDLPRLLGDTESGWQWPAELGAEPRWFLTEANFLVDYWRDCHRGSE